MLGRSGMYHLQPALVCRVRATIKRICGPRRNCRYNGPPLCETPDWLTATRCARRDDVLQNAKKTSTGSSPMAQEVRPHGATPLPCVLGYRAAALWEQFDEFGTFFFFSFPHQLGLL